MRIAVLALGKIGLPCRVGGDLPRLLKGRDEFFLFVVECGTRSDAARHQIITDIHSKRQHRGFELRGEVRLRRRRRVSDELCAGARQGDAGDNRDQTENE